MNNIALAWQYAEDVKSGKITVNRYIRMAIDRHFRDMAEAEDRGWYFHVEAAEKALMYFNFLVLTKGVTKNSVPPEQVNLDGSIRFQLAPWQAFMIASLFGWKVLETRKRRFTEAYVEIPKKNGKSTLASGIASYMLIADREAGPEVYFGAYSRDQASICFNEAVNQIKDSRELRGAVRILRYSVSNSANKGIMMAVSHDGNNTEGKNSHCAIIDEYHVHKTDKVKDSLQSGMAAREQPLMFVITTAGYNKNGPCYEHRRNCISTLEDATAAQVPDDVMDHLFILIFGIDEGDDWKDERNWIKANPTLGVTTKLSYIRKAFRNALKSGSKEVDFKTKHLNLWVDAEVTWIPREKWDECAAPDLKLGSEERFYIGIDLGRTSDISSVAMWFPGQNYLKYLHYVPEESAEYQVKAGNADYKKWIKDGHLIGTPGRTTNYKWIIRDIEDFAKKHKLKIAGYDPYGAQMFKDELDESLGTIWVNKKDENGKTKPAHYRVMQQVRQGFLTLGPPTALFEQMVIDGEIKHDGNPVTRWMLGNVQLDTDAAGNIKPAKDKSLDKIDGIAATVTALAVYSEWDPSIRKSTGVAAW